MIRIPAAAVLALALSGCASSLSGVGGTERYACKAPEGALCTSVSGVYANSIHGAFRPAESRLPRASSAPPSVYGATPLTPENAATADTAGTPLRRLRSNARVLRVWIAPWEDSDGDLHEASTVHVLVDTGRWLIEHVRPAKGRRVDGVAPPPPLVQEAAPAKTPSDPLPAGDVLPPAPGSAPAAVDAAPVEP
ncbi:MAG: type IV conjugative transfer system lipoprotein TraV [Burkholderiales bacterium]|nr:type IV conjugative transfer system lipoprotein TraV [Burkholderiales bacterium]